MAGRTLMIAATLGHNLLYSALGLTYKSCCHDVKKKVFTLKIHGDIFRVYFLFCSAS